MGGETKQVYTILMQHHLSFSHLGACNERDLVMFGLTKQQAEVILHNYPKNPMQYPSFLIFTEFFRRKIILLKSCCYEKFSTIQEI